MEGCTSRSHPRIGYPRFKTLPTALSLLRHVGVKAPLDGNRSELNLISANLALEFSG